jgi:phosphoserine phosphatase
MMIPPVRSASASASPDLPLAVGPAISASGGFEGAEMIIATLIAADQLTQEQIWVAADALDAAGFQCHRGNLNEERALDLQIIEPEDCDYSAWEAPPRLLEGADLVEERGRQIIAVRGALEAALGGLDVVVQQAEHRQRRLLVADMDSTMITVECIDELADFAGLKPQVAAVTEAAMRGELNFEAALEARVALLAGLDEQAIERCREERVRITPGAAQLVRTMRKRGAYTLLVSGGFTQFAEPVADQIGFDRAMANVLIVEDGKLTGAVRRPYVGAEAKREALLAAAGELGIGLECALAVGDGANDLPMIQAAGLGVAYHAKPVLAQAADARIDHNDLTALLYVQGIPRAEWAED